MRFIAFFVLVLLSPGPAWAVVVSFDSPRWRFHGETRVEEHLGQSALYVRNGSAVLDDLNFTNGILEFDVAVSGERGFPGAFWRMVTLGDYEQFYIRPHQSGNPDATQYTPSFHGSTAWQLYHGEGYGGPVEFVPNHWMHVKLVVNGSRAEVFIRNMETPVVTIHELKREVRPGKVGVVNSGDFAPAHFANFNVQQAANPPMKSASQPSAAAPAGTIPTWEVSSAFDESALEQKSYLSAEDLQGLSWATLTAESGGIVNLARIQGVGAGRNTALARAIVVSAEQQVKRLDLGFSDRVRVYCNGHLLYMGNNDYRSRDYRYLGTIGLFDAIYLPLAEGPNELLLAVSEDFGGWGLLARIEDGTGLRLVPPEGE